jgi:hypothetical protein
VVYLAGGYGMYINQYGGSFEVTGADDADDRHRLNSATEVSP